MAYTAKAHLRWGGGWLAPGDPVPEGDPDRNYALLLRTGMIEEDRIAVVDAPPERKAAPITVGKARAIGVKLAGQDGNAGPPPKVGKGSARDDWAAYAARQGVDPTGLSKAELIAALAPAS